MRLQPDRVDVACPAAEVLLAGFRRAQSPTQGQARQCWLALCRRLQEADFALLPARWARVRERQRRGPEP